MATTTKRGPLSSVASVAALALILATVGALVAYNTFRTASTAGPPHIDHVALPTHRVWHVTSVQPYEGLEEIELVKFDWPTREDAHLAFALSKEGLAVGDQICLDHVRDIDTFWAHPVPEGGCAARAPGGR